MRSLRVHRAIIPRFATPYLCANDQIHAQLHRDIKKELAEQIGLGPDLTKRKRFETKAKNRKGADEEMVARALYNAVTRMKAPTVGAAYVRCGYLSREALKGSFDTNLIQQELQSIQVDLDQQVVANTQIDADMAERCTQIIATRNEEGRDLKRSVGISLQDQAMVLHDACEGPTKFYLEVALRLEVGFGLL